MTDQYQHIGDEIRKYHESDAAHQRDDGGLPLAVQKVAESDRAEQ